MVDSALHRCLHPDDGCMYGSNEELVPAYCADSVVLVRAGLAGGPMAGAADKASALLCQPPHPTQHEHRSHLVQPEAAAQQLFTPQPMLLSSQPWEPGGEKGGMEAARTDRAVSAQHAWQQAAGAPPMALPEAASQPAAFTISAANGFGQEPPPAVVINIAEMQSSRGHVAGQHTQPVSGPSLQLWPASGSTLAKHDQAGAEQAGERPPRSMSQPLHTQQAPRLGPKPHHVAEQPAVYGHQPASGAGQQPAVKHEASTTGSILHLSQRNDSHVQLALGMLPPRCGTSAPGAMPGTAQQADEPAINSIKRQPVTRVEASKLPPVSVGLSVAPPPAADVVDLTRASGSDESSCLTGTH